jgi:hypothetical protein
MKFLASYKILDLKKKLWDLTLPTQCSWRLGSSRTLLGEGSCLVTRIRDNMSVPPSMVKGVQDPIISLDSFQFNTPKTKCNRNSSNCFGEKPVEKKGTEEQISALYYLFILSTLCKEQGNKRSVKHLADVRQSLRNRIASIRVWVDVQQNIKTDRQTTVVKSRAHYYYYYSAVICITKIFHYLTLGLLTNSFFLYTINR